MFSHQLYNVVHILGILLVFVALGGLVLHAANGGTRATNGGRRLVAITHGLGLFLVLLGGFGMLARLGVMHGQGFPGWIWGKLTIWVLLGAALMVPYRYPGAGRLLWFVVPLLGATAAYLAIYKPF